MKNMNFKKGLLLSTPIFVLAIASLSHLNSSRASDTPYLEADTTTQTSLKGISQTLAERSFEQLQTEIGTATYRLNEPAIQFDYDPNLFVLSSSEATRPDIQPLLISSTSFWSKEDYLTIANAGSELGDFPDKLRLAVYSNPEGIPALDWLLGWPGGESLGVEIKGLKRTADTTVAGQDTWTFSYRALFEYDGIVFQAANGQVVVITAYRSPADTDSESSEVYSTALSKMVESMDQIASASE